MTALIAVIIQFLDQVFNFPTGFDVVASLAEDWWESYRFIQSLKMVN
jgi:hypothetical protein